jgi:hypothetical protein
MDIRIYKQVPQIPPRSMEVPTLANRSDASSLTSNSAKWGTFLNSMCSAGQNQLWFAHISIVQ